MAGWFAKRRSKYGAVKVQVDGIKFDSKAEARRYGELKIMEERGMIRDLRIHPRFPLEVEGYLVCTYIGDFAYREPGTPYEVVEDVKGMETDVFGIKAKLFQVLYRDRELRVNGEKRRDLKRRVQAAGEIA
jgi:hypothetical protein